MDVKELSENAVRAMLDSGYNELTAWGEYSHVYNKIINEHEKCGESAFNESIVADFIESERKRFDDGEIALSTYKILNVPQNDLCSLTKQERF